MLESVTASQAVKPIVTMFKGAMRQTIKKGKKYSVNCVHPIFPEWVMLKRKGEIVFGWIHIKNLKKA